MTVSYTYWEGAVEIEGTLGGERITGSGYIELTGYAGSFEGEF
jgi:predicted secreted hydrolase